MMKLISLAQGQKEQIMTSKEISDLTGKRHADIIRDVRNLILEVGGDLAERSFALCSYLDSNNRSRPIYELTKKETLLLMSGYSAKLRLSIINRWEELELEVKQNLPSYQIENPIDRAKAWIVEYEEKVLLIETNTKLQFRSDFVDICFDADGVFSMEEVAKLLKLPFGRNTMLKELREKKLFLNSNTPKQSLIKAGYFKVVESLIENGGFKKVISATYATQKGLGYIHKMLDNKKALN